MFLLAFFVYLSCFASFFSKSLPLLDNLLSLVVYLSISLIIHVKHHRKFRWNEEQATTMSKLGAVGRGLYALIAFIVNIVLRVGLNVALVVGVAVSAHEAYKLTKSSGVLRKKEGKKNENL